MANTFGKASAKSFCRGLAARNEEGEAGTVDALTKSRDQDPRTDTHADVIRYDADGRS